MIENAAKYEKYTTITHLDFSADPVDAMAHCASVALQKTMTTGILMAGTENRCSSTCPREVNVTKSTYISSTDTEL